MGFRESLVEAANGQWTWFGKDLGRNDKFIGPDGRTTANPTTGGNANPRKETVEPYASRIADYWLAIPTADYDRLVKAYARTKGRLDGTIDIAWSAAFVSYCMQMAGAGPAFPYSSGHATWIVQSIRNRTAGKLNAGLVGYRPGEIPLAIGDLVGKPRGADAGVTYDTAVAKGWFVSHTDIVVDIDLPNRVAHAIGGNVGQTVGKSDIPITADGKLAAAGGFMVHIQDNISGGVTGKPPAPLAPHEAKVG